MLKVQASYSKKVPAESEYSSQSYHCTIEMELPDGLTPQQLNERVHGVFAFVRNSVESELHNAGQPQAAPAPQTVQVQPAPQNYQAVVSQPQGHAAPSARPRSGGSRGNGLASPKQIQYLLSLASRAGWDINEILRRQNVTAFEQLSSKTCSNLIDQLSGRVPAAA